MHCRTDTPTCFSVFLHFPLHNCLLTKKLGLQQAWLQCYQRVMPILDIMQRQSACCNKPSLWATVYLSTKCSTYWRLANCRSCNPQGLPGSGSGPSQVPHSRGSTGGDRSSKFVRLSSLFVVHVHEHTCVTACSREAVPHVVQKFSTRFHLAFTNTFRASQQWFHHFPVNPLNMQLTPYVVPVYPGRLLIATLPILQPPYCLFKTCYTPHVEMRQT